MELKDLLKVLAEDEKVMLVDEDVVATTNFIEYYCCEKLQSQKIIAIEPIENCLKVWLKAE